MNQFVYAQFVYTVNAFRFGQRNNHSYIVGVYPYAESALKAAFVEEKYRGGKYMCEVMEWILGEGLEGDFEKTGNVIKSFEVIKAPCDE